MRRFFQYQGKIVLLLIVFSIPSQFIVNAQTGAFTSPPVQIFSPEVANLGKYGSYNVNLYTGTPNITVPITEINEIGVKIPIALSYDASGFMPNKKPGKVGLNWNLIAGGAVTRVVNNIPDETHHGVLNETEDIFKWNNGYLFGVQNNLATCNSPCNIENLSFLTFSSQGNAIVSSEVGCELYPDIFSFNFLGHSGTFFMDRDNIPKVVSNRKYKIDMSGLIYSPNDNIVAVLTNYQVNLNTEILSSLKITSDDGYVFSFGGKLSALEISFSFVDPESRVIADRSGRINSWYLTKIESPTGEIINFDYGEYTPSEIEVFRNIRQMYETPGNPAAAFMDVSMARSEIAFNYYDQYQSSNGEQPNGRSKFVIKQAYLKKITTPLKSISFSYIIQDVTKKFYPQSEYTQFVSKNANYFTSILDNIEIIENNFSGVLDDAEDLIERCSQTYMFTYDYVVDMFNSPNYGYRIFLNNMKNIASNEVFSFFYSRLNQLPAATTKGIDIRGYYNGHDENAWLVKLNGVPEIGVPGEDEPNFSYQYQVREANENYANVGLLEKIVYPTGGKTEFEFEVHTYKKILKRKVNPISGNSAIPEFVELSQNAYEGGARIKKITNTPGIVYNYRYVTSLNPGDDQSSGIISDQGVFRIKRYFGNSFHDQIFDDNITKTTGIHESPIGYSSVIEEIGDGSEGFTRYIFTTHFTNPDFYTIGPNSFKVNPIQTPIPTWIQRLHIYSSTSVERGKVKLKEIYRKDATTNSLILVSSTETKFNNDPNRLLAYVSGYDWTYDWKAINGQLPFPGCEYFNAFRLFYYQDEPTQIIEKTFSNGQILTKTTDLLYKSNTNPLLVEKKYTESDGTTVRITYSYPEDPDQIATHLFMINKFMVNAVLQEKTYKNQALVQTQKYVYQDVFNNGSVIKPIKQLKTLHFISPSNEETYSNISYYSNGKVKEVFKSGDFKTLYFWDYQKSFPVAEIKNIDNPIDAAYSSFETSETGGWTYNNAGANDDPGPVTGLKVFQLLNGSSPRTVTKSGLNPAKKYTLSFWVRGNPANVNGLTPIKQRTRGLWTYNEYLITGLLSVTITGNCFIDELRLYPTNAFMTTYTYRPCSGISSKCDEDNRISYFFYDAANRLSYIRDQNKKIIKKYCYNFFGQTTPCP